MYLRCTTKVKDGKSHRYWRLVESVRVGSRVIQRTVATLGELDEQGRIKARALARMIVGEPEQADIFDDGCTDRVVSINLRGVRIEKSRGFGDVYLARALWHGLELDRFCRDVLGRGQEHVPWEKVACVLTCARLCEPSSELHIAEDWYRKTALGDFLQLNDDLVNKDRLYRGLDQLLEHKEELEEHLVRRCGELFEIDNQILLYDMTSTYFEGLAEGNPLAKRGYSRDHRPDCKQVCVALVVSFDGFPLGHEVFSGNTHDSTTVEEIVTTMEKRHGAIGRVWVMDRGMVSKDNIEWLQKHGKRYLIGTPKAQMKEWAAELADKEHWREVRDGVEVKICRGPDGDETFILCRSQQRRDKEKAIHERFSERIQEALEKLKRRLAKSRKAANKTQVNRQIGRILQGNQRAAARFEVTLVDDNSPAGFHLDFTIREDFDQWAEISEGTYILRSNVADWTNEQLWKTYIQLTQAEAAFRIQKDQLCIRPIWHQKANRVKAHILVCFLAFVMWKALEKWQEKAGLGNSPRTILEEIKGIQCHDVILPTSDGTEIRLRCVVQPNPEQKIILERLGLTLPKRLRIATNPTNSSVIL